MPVTVAHGEGRAEFSSAQPEQAAALVTLRFVDNHGQVTERYPFNPNGSLHGMTGLTTRRAFQCVDAASGAGVPRDAAFVAPGCTLWQSRRRSVDALVPQCA